MVCVQQIKVGSSWMDSIVQFLKEDVLPDDKSKLTRYEGRLLGFGCLRIKSCIRGLFLAYIYYAYTLRRLSYSWKNYMKESVEATRGADLCLIRPSHKAIGGQIYKKKHKTMQKNVTNVRDLPQTFTNLEESLIP